MILHLVDVHLTCLNKYYLLTYLPQWINQSTFCKAP